MLEILRHRRSIRKFKQQAVEAEKIEQLTEALLRSPSSRNRRPWEFVLVDDPELVQKLALSKAHGTGFLETAPLAVVICADPQQCDVWIEDCSIAAIILQLTAESLGLKSCWGQLRERPHNDKVSAGGYVRELLQIPEGFEVPIVVGLGYPDEEKEGLPSESLPFDKVHTNRFSV